EGGQQAAVHELAVEKDRARSALPLAAAFLRPGQAQLVAQDVEDAAHRVGCQGTRLAVQREADAPLPGLRQSRPPWPPSAPPVWPGPARRRRRSPVRWR